MKKARATKILCAVLTVIMVLGTGLSAMAAVTGTSVVKYNVDKTAYGVTTEVSGLAENEMVTYLVHNASSMYNVAPSNIDFIDQKNANGTTAQFGYKGTGDWETKANKIYIGAESLAAPVESSATLAEEGVVVTVNGVLMSGVAIDGKDAAGIKKITLDSVPYISNVTYNGDAVDFFKVGDAIAFYTDAALNEETDVIAMTTGGAVFADDPTANGVLSAADLIAMGKATQPTDGTLNNSKAGLASYSNGQISSWDGIIANVKGVSGGEHVASAFWYPNTTTLGEAGYETSLNIAFESGKTPYNGIVDDEENADKIEATGGVNGGNSYGALQDQVADMIDAYEAGDASYTFDATNYVPQGITLMTSGDDIEVSLTVPAAGEYKLIARQNVWTIDRTTNLTVNGKTLSAKSETVQAWSVASSDDTVTLEAGTYTATIDGTATAPVRFDFLALVPATEAADSAYAAGQEALMDYLAAGVFSIGDVGVKLGTVKAEGNSFVAFGRVKGEFTECGIEMYTDDYYTYPALGVSGVPGLSNGGFAIELIDEDGVDLAEEFSGAEVTAYAIDADDAPVYSETYYMD